MTSYRSPQVARLLLICVAAAGWLCVGCTTLELPALPYATDSAPTYRTMDGSPLLHSVSEQTYHSIRRARSENAIVLQIVDDKEVPVRVLPLPPEDKSVYVSDLLTQTGVQQKLGTVEATLFRHSTDTIGGIPMAVDMTPDGKRVRPETDYALQAGDRLRVQKKKIPPLVDQLIGSVLGI